VDYTTADKYGSGAPSCQSISAVADIIGKPESLLRVKKSLTYDSNIDTVLAENMFQFKPPALPSVRIPAAEAQGFTPLCYPRACCHIRLQRMTVYRTTRGRAAPVGMEEMDVRSRRVSSIHWGGR
jgi:hypothetical protein